MSSNRIWKRLQFEPAIAQQTSNAGVHWWCFRRFCVSSLKSPWHLVYPEFRLPGTVLVPSQLDERGSSGLKSLLVYMWWESFGSILYPISTSPQFLSPNRSNRNCVSFLWVQSRNFLNEEPRHETNGLRKIQINKSRSSYSQDCLSLLC